jgi:hypothetical protein
VGGDVLPPFLYNQMLCFSGQSKRANFGFLRIFLAIFIFGAWLALRFSKLTKR